MRYREAEGSRRGCAFLAAATELPVDHPGQPWLRADSRMLTDRLRELAVAAGVADPDEVATTLLLCYDGALARSAREWTAPELPAADPVQRARALAAAWLARQGHIPGT